MPRPERLLRLSVCTLMIVLLCLPVAMPARADDSATGGAPTETTENAQPDPTEPPTVESTEETENDIDVACDDTATGCAPDDNQPLVFSLMVETHDAETDQPLIGACYQLTDPQGAPITADTCDDSDGADGSTSFSDLPVGDYIVVQTAAPDGFLLADPQPVSVGADGNEITFANAPVPPTLTPTSAPTLEPTTGPTLEPTTEPTERPARPTRTPRPSRHSTATPTSTPTSTETTGSHRVSAASVSTTGFRIKMIDDDGGLVSASCIRYQGYDSGSSPVSRTACDGAANEFGGANNDAAADGYIEVANLAPGRWFIQGNEARDTNDPAPLPLIVTVTDGAVTQAALVFHRYGSLEVKTRGETGQLIDSCVKLGWDWAAIGGNASDYNEAYTSNAGQRCDSDDGTQDGITHFWNLPVGVYWAQTYTPGKNPKFGNALYVRITEETPVSVTSYLPSAQITITLVDATTGNPVNDIFVAVMEVVGPGRYAILSTQRIDGTATYSLSPGTYIVKTTRDTEGHDRYELQETSVTLTSPGERATVTLRLQPKTSSSPTPASTPTRTPSPTPTKTPTKTPTSTPTKTPDITPVCTGSASSGIVGSTLVITCTGYNSRESISVFWDSAKTPALKTVKANAHGVAKATITIPEARQGAHKLITWSGTVGGTVSVKFAVKPSIVLSPTSGHSGKTVKVTLHGFAANDSLNLRWYMTNGTSYQTVKSNQTVSTTGQATFSIVIPANQTKGTHRLIAVGKNTGQISATFKVT